MLAAAETLGGALQCADRTQDAADERQRHQQHRQGAHRDREMQRPPPRTAGGRLLVAHQPAPVRQFDRCQHPGLAHAVVARRMVGQLHPAAWRRTPRCTRQALVQGARLLALGLVHHQAVGAAASGQPEARSRRTDRRQQRFAFFRRQAQGLIDAGHAVEQVARRQWMHHVRRHLAHDDGASVGQQHGQQHRGDQLAAHGPWNQAHASRPMAAA